MTCVLKIYPNYINLSLLNGIYLAKNTEQQNRLPSAYDPDLHQKKHTATRHKSQDTYQKVSFYSKRQDLD